MNLSTLLFSGIVVVGGLGVAAFNRPAAPDYNRLAFDRVQGIWTGVMRKVNQPGQMPIEIRFSKNGAEGRMQLKSGSMQNIMPVKFLPDGQIQVDNTKNKSETSRLFAEGGKFWVMESDNQRVTIRLNEDRLDILQESRENGGEFKPNDIMSVSKAAE